MYRLVTSGRIACSPGQVLNEWTLEQLIDAHAALDVWDELERKAAEPKK